MKLSPAQIRLLTDMAQTRARGISLRPGGYATAGRDARAWTQSGHVLVREGLARWTENWNLKITDAGLAALAKANA